MATAKHYNEPKNIGALNVSSNGEQYTINNPNSDFHGTTIALPQESSLYNISIYEAETEDGSILHISPSIEMNNPIKVTFDFEKEIGMFKESGEEISLGAGTVIFGNSYVKRTMKDVLFCASENIKSHYEYEGGVKYFFKSFENRGMFYPNMRIWVEESSHANANFEQKLSSFLNDRSTLDKIQSTQEGKVLDVYFKSFTKSFLGIVYQNDFDILNINFSTPAVYNSLETLKYTFLHEYHHVLQHRIMGCNQEIRTAKKYSPAIAAIIEGSADSFAINSMNDSNKHLVDVNGITKFVTDKEFAVSFRYSNYTLPGAFVDYFENGIFNIPKTSQYFKEHFTVKRFDPSYESRILFESYRGMSRYYYEPPEYLIANEPVQQLNGLVILDYLIKNFNKYSSTDIRLGEKVILDYTKAKNINFSQILMYALDSSVHEISLVDLSVNSTQAKLHDKNLFNWFDNQTVLPNDGSIYSTNILASSFGGFTREFDLRKEGSGLNKHAISLLTIDNGNEESIKAEIVGNLDVIERIPAASKSFDGNTQHYLIYAAVTNEHRSKWRLNLVNTGLNNKNIKATITPLCKEFTIPLPPRDKHVMVVVKCTDDNCSRAYPLIMSKYNVTAEEDPRGFTFLNYSFEYDSVAKQFYIYLPGNGLHSEALVCQANVHEEGAVELNFNATVMPF